MLIAAVCHAFDRRMVPVNSSVQNLNCLRNPYEILRTLQSKHISSEEDFPLALGLAACLGSLQRLQRCVCGQCRTERLRSQWPLAAWDGGSGDAGNSVAFFITFYDEMI